MSTAPIDMEQGSPEYVAWRIGKATASRIADILAKPRSGQKVSTTRRNYMAQLVCEILTNKSAEREFMTRDMQRGIELEPRARVEYEMLRGVTVRKAGFIDHPAIQRCGCSPDGLVGDDGLVQFKCPIPAIHFDYIESSKLKTAPAEYFPQLQFELACTGRKWNDFVSYNEQMPEHLQLVVIRVEREDKYIAEVEDAVRQFLRDVDEQIEKLPQAVQP